MTQDSFDCQVCDICAGGIMRCEYYVLSNNIIMDD